MPKFGTGSSAPGQPSYFNPNATAPNSNPSPQPFPNVPGAGTQTPAGGKSCIVNGNSLQWKLLTNGYESPGLALNVIDAPLRFQTPVRELRWVNNGGPVTACLISLRPLNLGTPAGGVTINGNEEGFQLTTGVGNRSVKFAQPVDVLYITAANAAGLDWFAAFIGSDDICRFGDE